MVGFAGWRGFARGSSSWKAFFRHGGGFLRAAGVQGLLRWVTCWGGSWWAPEWQGLLGGGFLVGRGSSSWTGFFRHGGGFLYGRVCLTLAFWYAWVGQGRVSDMLGWSWWDPEW